MHGAQKTSAAKMALSITNDNKDEHLSSVSEHSFCSSVCVRGSAATTTDECKTNSDCTEIFAIALGCYPIALSISQHLDLNSLHDLSTTCRRFRNNLLLYRKNLVRQSLRCVNDKVDTTLSSPEQTRLLQAISRGISTQAWTNTTTKSNVNVCARDFVGDCRRCDQVVCRNCTIKPPPSPAYKHRHRRLCRTCQKVPLTHLTSNTYEGSNGKELPRFTANAFSRGYCVCPTVVHICLSCGNSMRGADTTYMRGWTWRTRYSTYLGGLGTGIGEGNEGVHCGREERCLAARDVEKEIDCHAEELIVLQEAERVGLSGRAWTTSTSYLTQEIEGIGGIVKRKVKKRVRVGAVVKEYEDERENGCYLRREQEGKLRSWCHWCSRVIPSHDDMEIHQCM